MKAYIRVLIDRSIQATATAVYHIVGDISSIKAVNKSEGIDSEFLQLDYYQQLNIDIARIILSSNASRYTYVGSWCQLGQQRTSQHRLLTNSNDAYHQFILDFCDKDKVISISSSQQPSIRVIVTNIDAVYGPGVKNLHGALNGIFNRVFMSTHHIGANRQLIVDQGPHEYVDYVCLSDLVDNIITSVGTGPDGWGSSRWKEVVWIVNRIASARMYAIVSTIVGVALELNMRPYCCRGSHLRPCDGNVNADKSLMVGLVQLFIDRSVLWKLSLDMQYDGDDEFHLDFHNFGYVSPILKWWLNKIDRVGRQRAERDLTKALTSSSSSSASGHERLVESCPVSTDHTRKKTLLFRHDGSHINLPYYTAYMPRLQQAFHVCTCAKSMKCLKCKDELGRIDVYLIGQSFMNFLKRNHSRFTASEVRSIPADCYVAFLNKEYLELAHKLSFIAELRPDVVFTHHHNLTEFMVIAPEVSFARIPFATNVLEFNTYANASSSDIPYTYDVSTSGSTNMINSLDYRSWYEQHGIALFQSRGINATLSGWTDSLEHYRSNMIRTKMWFSTSSMGDLVGVRAFEVMATNRTLLLFNRHVDKRMTRGLIDDDVAVLFSSTDELLEMVTYYNSHENERLHIVHNAYRRAMESHDWSNRADLMMRYLDNC